jgi:uncharacterized protein YndB with AHSA1/START domain
MASGLVLELRRRIEAPPSIVFAACVDPAQVAQWWGPLGFAVPSAEMDVRPGGGYRIEMQPPEGEAFVLEGEYLEVNPPQRLAYTFRWDPPDPDDVETVVTLNLGAASEGTEVALGQEGFATEARRRLHEEGWTDTLERLDRFLGPAGHG